MSKMGNYVIEQQELYSTLISEWVPDVDIIKAFQRAFNMSEGEARRSVEVLGRDDWEPI
tara:strand:+ start:213 stop:389 length:177 start_codon:yes stop_codon:yes gene_type:complete